MLSRKCKVIKSPKKSNSVKFNVSIANNIATQKNIKHKGKYQIMRNLNYNDDEYKKIKKKIIFKNKVKQLKIWKMYKRNRKIKFL